MTARTKKNNARTKRAGGFVCVLMLLPLVGRPMIATRAEAASRYDSASGSSQRATKDASIETDSRGRLVSETATRRLEFSPAGIRYLLKSEFGEASAHEFEYRLKGVSRGKLVEAVNKLDSPPMDTGDEVCYFRSPSVIEKYRAGETGLEQSIVVDESFARRKGDLLIDAELGGDLESEGSSIRSVAGLTFRSSGRPMLSLAPTVVNDANGNELIPEMRLETDQLKIVIDHSWLEDKKFPLTVKSTIQTVDGQSEDSKSQSSGRFSIAVAEDMPVWRAQVRLQTADLSNAGTDDDVSVQLNEPGNKTCIDYGRNDFERADAYTYDLVLDNVHSLRDISMLRISKTGTDGWCLRLVTLYVNGRAIYSLDFGSLGRWFDIDPGNDHRSYTVSYTALRAHSMWTSYEQPAPPLLFPRQELKSRVESHVGDYMIKNTGATSCGYLRWGGLTGSDYVEVGRTNVQTIHFDLDLKMFVHLGLDYNYDVDFDLEFSCSNGKIIVVTKNLRSNNGSCTAEGWLGVYLYWQLPAQIQAALNNYTYMFAGQPTCPSITVLDDASISLAFPRVR